MHRASIILMGARGAGKTSIARRAGELLSRRVIDLDDCTAAACGCATPAEAFTSLGESAFRIAELDALRRVFVSPGLCVLALGGGTPTIEAAQTLLMSAKQCGRARLVYLFAPADVLRARLAATDVSSRPPLRGGSMLGEIEQVLAERDAIYRKLACEVMDTSVLSVEEAAGRVAGLAGAR